MSNDIPTKQISQSLSKFMCDIKEKIHKHEADWDTYKKHTNPYEYIHTNHPHKKRPVSKYKPLSRSYFKMIEISHELSIFPFSAEVPRTSDIQSTVGVREIPSEAEVEDLSSQVIITTAIRTFHLAEGPGGFIEAVANLRKNPKDVYIGMTIQDTKNDGTIPTWKKSEHFLHANPNVFIENGMDGTGDILSVANFKYCSENYSSSMDLITADGGFDFSTDFNNQELQIARLLFAQIAFALVMQKRHGNFVLKIFDCFYGCTVDLLLLLSSFYKTVYITKPKTSRFGNSEKYVVCKDFIYESSADFFPYLHSAFTCDDNSYHSTASPSIHRTPPMFIHRFLSVPIPYHFLIKLEEYNSIFGISQIENIHNTILLIERKLKPERIDQMIQSNIVKCIEWCIQYGVPYKPISQYNTFL
jgi:23S rRNA U2552 (ribose-2'-O)-methylase RlmE/FtsJ